MGVRPHLLLLAAALVAPEGFEEGHRVLWKPSSRGKSKSQSTFIGVEVQTCQCNCHSHPLDICLELYSLQRHRATTAWTWALKSDSPGSEFYFAPYLLMILGRCFTRSIMYWVPDVCESLCLLDGWWQSQLQQSRHQHHCIIPSPSPLSPSLLFSLLPFLLPPFLFPSIHLFTFHPFIHSFWKKGGKGKRSNTLWASFKSPVLYISYSILFHLIF